MRNTSNQGLKLCKRAYTQATYCCHVINLNGCHVMCGKTAGMLDANTKEANLIFPNTKEPLFLIIKE
jgi:hypothetical protein